MLSFEKSVIGKFVLANGSPAATSDYGETYAGGVSKLHGKTLVAGAGLGTRLLPMRLFTQPEIWVVEVRGK